MRKIVSLAFANIRKNKGQSLSFFIIIFVSALFLSLGLVTMFEYTENFDKKALQQEAPDVMFAVQEDREELLTSFEKEMASDKRVISLAKIPALLAAGEFYYGNGLNSRNAVFFEASDDGSIPFGAIMEKTDKEVEDPIYLPYLFKMGGGYSTGEPFHITLVTAGMGKKEFSFTIAGFYEDIYFSTINSTITGFLLGERPYGMLKEALGSGPAGCVYAVEASGPDDNERVSSVYGTKLGNICNGAGLIWDSNHYASVKSARTVTSSIGTSIIVGFSVLLLLIALVVVNFRIKNSVEEEIRNIGALKALGYTSSQLIGTFLMQFTVLSLAGGLLGILCSYGVLPALSLMYAMQTGIVWEQSFSGAAFVLTLALTEVLVCFVAFTSSVRIRKLPPIAALRTGLQTHSFRKNYFPLDKGRGPLIVIMAAKQLVRSIKQNILIGLIVTGVTFAAVFAGVLYYNINIEKDIFIQMVAGETPHLQLEAGGPEAAERLLEHVREKEGTDKAFYFSTEVVTCEQNYEAYGYILNDFDMIDNTNWLYQGRFPRYDNETALGGLLAEILDKKPGDTITVTQGDVSRDYLITGLIQGSNYMGHDLCMTSEAYQRINEGFSPTMINAYLKDRIKAGEFLEELMDSSADLLNAVNADEMIRSSMSSYQDIVAVLAVVVSLVTAVIIILVLYLVIKTLLVRKKQELGIQKALGYTTGELVLQNALAFLPVVLIGALLGGWGGCVGLNPFFSLLFSGIGMMKVGFVICMPLIIGICAFIAAFGFAVAAIVSLRIKKISPYSLISE